MFSWSTLPSVQLDVHFFSTAMESALLGGADCEEHEGEASSQAEGKETRALKTNHAPSCGTDWQSGNGSTAELTRAAVGGRMQCHGAQNTVPKAKPE